MDKLDLSQFDGRTPEQDYVLCSHHPWFHINPINKALMEAAPTLLRELREARAENKRLSSVISAITERVSQRKINGDTMTVTAIALELKGR